MGTSHIDHEDQREESQVKHVTFECQTCHVGSRNRELYLSRWLKLKTLSRYGILVPCMMLKHRILQGTKCPALFCFFFFRLLDDDILIL